MNKTSTLPPLAQSFKCALNQLNHTAPSPLFPLGDTRAWSFSIWYSQLNHHKQDSHITRGKSSYSLIEPQLLPSTPAYGHEVYALVFHLHPTFAAPLVGSAFKILIPNSWTTPASWFSWFTPNTNTITCKLGPTPRSHFLEGERIHVAGKAKSVWPIVGRMPLKAEWWDAPLALQGFGRSNILWYLC